jgi:hypothetical protein
LRPRGLYVWLLTDRPRVPLNSNTVRAVAALAFPWTGAGAALFACESVTNAKRINSQGCAVKALLASEKWRGMSDREIANAAGVGAPFVRKFTWQQIGAPKPGTEQEQDPDSPPGVTRAMAWSAKHGHVQLVPLDEKSESLEIVS